MKQILFTPGPLTTSDDVKKSMLKDYGSRDDDFIKIIKNIRNKLLDLACIHSKKIDLYTCVLIQGSGTYSIEATLNSLIPKNDTNDKNNQLLIISNGKYGDRLKDISNKSNICNEIIRFDESEKIGIDLVKKTISENKNIKYLAMIHHETSTGQLNSLSQISDLCKQYNITFIVDSMSAFGAVDLDIYDMNIDFLISSSNKCLEGVPGFSYVICNKDKLKECIYSSSLCLDILDQYNNFELNGQFRFTPPTHTLLAFNYALNEYEKLGGLQARINKYKNNYMYLKSEMVKLGFRCFLNDEQQGYFITSFHYFDNEQFSFNDFYDYLKQNGLIIYPGKTTKLPTFRIGNIGNITKDDITNLLHKIKEYLDTIN